MEKKNLNWRRVAVVGTHNESSEKVTSGKEMDIKTVAVVQNYHSCEKAGAPPTAPKSAEYQVMGGCYKNRIMFAKRNGFYIFKAIVVHSSYSFCELSTTFGVFIYGAYPEITYSSELVLGAFILSVAMSSSDSPVSWLGSPASCSSPVQVRGQGRPSCFHKRISNEDAEEFQCNSDQHNSRDPSENNDDCLEYNEWIPPTSDTIQKIIAQVEFYLSDENLAVDSFLLKHMKRNKMGYISIKLLTSFKKVKCLTKNWKVTAYALNYSKLLEINPEGIKVRRKNPVPEFLLSVPPSKRILAWNLCKDSPEDNSEICGHINIMETAMKIFGFHGSISSIRILQPGKEIPAELKKYSLKYPEVGTKVCILVEYECYEGAKKAYEELGKKHCHNGENPKVVILTGKGTKKINGLDTDESEDLKRSNSKKSSRWPAKTEQMQYTMGEPVYSSSESDGANSPSVQRYLQHRICDACNCNSQISSTASWSQSWSGQHCSPCISHRSLTYHHPSPLADFVGQEVWPSPGTSPEFTKKFHDHLPDSGNYSGSPWVQRRKLAASQVASLEINQTTCKQSVRKHQSGTGFPSGLVRLPFGPDGTKGFHNSIGRGKIVLRH
ncbi:la-related protein 6-like [Carcharodon carcharias]|uniref:la-related protein 6-like n=1 Tax=Carcharodon carcharias TaxID=13397 RepID=UPI001B7F4930|nr:la-related protein 6-like [Carcharodon carcharias]